MSIVEAYMEQQGLKVKRIDKGSTHDPVTVENAELAKAHLSVERVDAATEVKSWLPPKIPKSY